MSPTSYQTAPPRSKPEGDRTRRGWSVSRTGRSAGKIASRRSWRRGWDSNPRSACADNGFRDRPVRPLRHPSKCVFYNRLGALGQLPDSRNGEVVADGPRVRPATLRRDAPSHSGVLAVEQLGDAHDASRRAPRAPALASPPQNSTARPGAVRESLASTSSIRAASIPCSSGSVFVARRAGVSFIPFLFERPRDPPRERGVFPPSAWLARPPWPAPVLRPTSRLLDAPCQTSWRRGAR